MESDGKSSEQKASGRSFLITNGYQGIKNGTLAIAWTNGYTIFRFGGWLW